MSSWPGIPSGKGSTCAEEGCGNPRRARGNECRNCYKLKWIQHRRSTGQIADGAGGYEVGFTSSTVRELDGQAFSDWQNEQHDD